MDSFNQTTEFMYNPNNTSIDDAVGDSEFSGILEIYVHHARNIHNICIYDKQDVYAKFSLTYNPDETLSTTIINGGGKNPDFNQSLIMKITQLDAVLKCEIWMLSRARNFLEDQLLGFALVPVSLVKGKGKVTQEFSLSSTDLFHSPAGTVKLSLSLSSSSMPHASSSFQNSTPNSSISSEVVLLDRKVSDINLDPIEFSRIEFPEINVVRENQKMVSQYFSSGYQTCLVGPASFLHLGACPQPADDYEMVCNSSDDNREGFITPDGQTSTTTSLSDDRNSSRNSIDQTIRLANEKSITIVANATPSISPETPTSRTGITINHGNNMITNPDISEEVKQETTVEKVFPAALGNITLEAEQSAMQQQIVDMYMRSMQQFTESLAKMKLPMDMAKVEESGEVIHNHSNNIEADAKKKDGSRVFYGSRAFF